MSTLASRTLLVGCGKVGTRLAERLIADGGEAFGLRRTTASLPSSIIPLAVDLLSPPPVSLPQVDTMVITITPSIGGSDHPDGYATALKHLAEALPSPPERTVMVSSTGIFDGPGRAEPISEADPAAPVTPRAERLLEGEALAKQLFGAHIVRPAGIYGPGRGMRLRKVLSGESVQYARRTNRIHETDLVSILHAMLTHPSPPELLHAVDQHPAPLGEVVTFIADLLALSPPPRITPEEPSGNVFDGSRLSGWFGELQFPSYQDGYRQLIAERQTHHP
ncbi:SDR family NAD(P)-dependent oxidoreductase [Nesterenkonia populi]|uniref:SDR family NAD(P)-dependent oxidoreductase n=1 Tax=Nesterenkonia populi TaxID=1591087 RepID=UPI0011BE52BD|nr:SDR family NAD(P)-dependent oxidoreductase [Nesterenkonia populi]